MTRVLVVQDDPSLEHLADVLRAQGYTVEVIPEAAPLVLPPSPTSIREALHEAAEARFRGRSK